MRYPILACFVLSAASACAPEDRTGAANGARLFAENCAACHGADARGYDGPARDWAGLPPPDLTRLARRNGGTFPQVEVLSTVDGLRRHSDRDAVMPEFGARDLGPTVVVELETGIGTPVPADLLALSAYLRTVQR